MNLGELAAYFILFFHTFQEIHLWIQVEQVLHVHHINQPTGWLVGV